MKKTIRTILNIALSALLIFGIVKLGLSIYNNNRSREEYGEAMEIAVVAKPEESSRPAETMPPQAPSEDKPEVKIPDDPFIKELFEIDLNALREENEDVIGWIIIPDTRINYPLLQWTDNEFYLDHTWKQTRNPAGSIFMDYQNSADFDQFNTIIYGHNIMNGDMFGSLHSYRTLDYLQQHPYVYIVTDEGVMRFDVFAAQFAGIETIVYGLNIESEQKKKEFLRYVQDYSSVETELSPTIEDKFLTLSTCTGGNNEKRMVVIGVFNEENSYKRP